MPTPTIASVIRFIGLDDPIGEELQHGCHFLAHQHGESDGRANAQFFGQDGAARDQVAPHIRGPLRLAAGEDPSGQALAAAKPKPERHLAETAKSLRIFGVAGVRGHQLVRVVGGRQQRVPEAPPVVRRHPPETVLHGLLGVLGVIGHGGDVVEHLDCLGSFGDALLKGFLRRS